MFIAASRKDHSRFRYEYESTYLSLNNYLKQNKTYSLVVVCISKEYQHYTLHRLIHIHSYVYKVKYNHCLFVLTISGLCPCIYIYICVQVTSVYTTPSSEDSRVLPHSQAPSLRGCEAEKNNGICYSIIHDRDVYIHT